MVEIRIAAADAKRAPTAEPRDDRCRSGDDPARAKASTAPVPQGGLQLSTLRPTDLQPRLAWTPLGPIVATEFIGKRTV
jgi:hypothetical protein